jgi:hypothetical protein
MTMPKPNLAASDSVLIVEGYSDLLFYAELLEWLGKPPIYIHHMNGVATLAAEIEVFFRSAIRAKKSIAVVVDADHDVAARVMSIEHVLSRITKQHVVNGQWTTGSPRIGVFVVPGNGKTGEIESLTWKAWSNDPRNAGAAGCVDGFLSCMQAQGHLAKSPDKGRINAVLSVLHDDDPRLGPGARSGIFDFSRPEFASLVEFLRQA